MPDFKITDRRLSTLYPPPPKPFTPKRSPVPRQEFCWEVLANPDAHDSRRCSHWAGHNGRHAWEFCRSVFDPDGVSDYGCERDKGHDGDHRVTIEW